MIYKIENIIFPIEYLIFPHKIFNARINTLKLSYHTFF